MKCPRCTEQVPDDSRFCPYCGSTCELVSAEPAPAAEPTLMPDRALPDARKPNRSGAPRAGSGPGSPGGQGDEPVAVSRATYVWAVFGFIGGLIGWAVVKERDPKLGRNVLIAGAAVSVGGFLLYTIALGGLLAGLSSGNNSTVTSEPATSAEKAYTEAPSGSGLDIALQSTINEFSWVYVDDADQRLRVDVMVDEPVRLSDSPYYETSDGVFFDPGDACGITDDTTGIVPVDFQLTNESDTTVAADLDFSIDADYERFFTNDHECFSYESSSGTWDDGIEPGDTGGTMAAVLVPGYFAEAEGDRTLLEAITVTPESTNFAGVDELTGESATGAGFTLLPSGTTVATESPPSEDATGYYTGTMDSYTSDTVYDVVLDLTQNGSEVTGTVTATSRKTGNRGSYEAAGYFEGGRVVLNGKDWVDKPNPTWFMDHLDLQLDADTLSGTYAPLDKPGKAVGDVYVSR